MNAIRPQCRLTVAIPAKNEAGAIERALEAFAAQRDLDGLVLDPLLFEIIVFANDCSDDTAAVVRNFAARNPGYAVHVFERALPRGAAHVGTARRIVLDAAYDRQVQANGTTGIIASTDADSAVGPFWVARTFEEMRRVDAVAGFVEISASERDAMEAPLRVLYDRELAYRRALGEVEASFDPREFDPPHRHASFVGASFAVRGAAYEAAGRLPALARLEDVAFSLALRRIDARVCHPYDVHVETSGRVVARVPGGFGAFIEELRERGARRETFLVENGRRMVLRARARGALRAYWTSPKNREALANAASLYGTPPSVLAGLLDTAAPFGETLERVEALPIAFEALPDETVEASLATLRAAIAAVKPASTTRVRTASGAR